MSFLPGTLTGRLNGRDRDRDQPSAQGKKNSGKIPVHFVGARGARARFTDGVREHHRRRTHPGASTDNAETRTRGRVTLSWQCSLSTTNAMYESLGLCHCFFISGQDHTQCYYCTSSAYEVKSTECCRPNRHSALSALDFIST